MSSAAEPLSVLCTTARLVHYRGYGGDAEFADQAVTGAHLTSLLASFFPLSSSSSELLRHIPSGT